MEVFLRGPSSRDATYGAPLPMMRSQHCLRQLLKSMLSVKFNISAIDIPTTQWKALQFAKASTVLNSGIRNAWTAAWIASLFAVVANGQEAASRIATTPDVTPYPTMRVAQFTEHEPGVSNPHYGQSGIDPSTLNQPGNVTEVLPSPEPVSEFGDIGKIDASQYHTDSTAIESGIGQWPTYATYFKAGPSFGFGGYFGDDRRVGFALQGGVREGFGGCSPWFFDLGGSFQTIGGRDLPTTSDGFVPSVQPGVIPDTVVTDAMTSTLREIRRASIQTAIGYYFQPMSGPTYEMLFSWRFGSRLGHAKADFERVINDANPAGTELIKPFADADDFLGLFGGVEWVLKKREFLGGDMSFVVDAEVANEWIEFDGLAKDALPTASVLFGLTLRR